VTAEAPESTASSIVETMAGAPGTMSPRRVEERFLARERQFRHDNILRPFPPVPGEPVMVVATAGLDMPLRSATLRYTTDGSWPGDNAAEIPMHVAGVEWHERIAYITRWEAEIPAQPEGTVVRYRIRGDRRDGGAEVWAHDGQGFWYRFEGEAGITTFAYQPEAPRPPMPTWMHDAVIYHIFLDRFHPGTPDGIFTGPDGPRERHGGTLNGVRQALPYIADLGVTCIWLSPLHPSESYHRYDTLDYFDVDPLLGTREDLRALVEEAHSRGIRVLMDFVPSHLSHHHPAFLAAQADQHAPTASWFTFDRWPDTYRCFLQVSKSLPSINTEDPAARQHLIDSAVYWMREFGVDGYRMDHVIAPSMDFWVAFRRAVEAANPEVVTIGEATDTPDGLRRYRGRLHSLLDFELAAALRFSFGAGAWSLAQLDAFVTSYERYMADAPGRVGFLDNHDMDRFLWVAGNDVERLELAALCLFTLAPTPVLYYGTEIGMSQMHGARELGFGGDANARENMIWDPARWNTDLLAYFRRLIRLRREHPVLATGLRHTIHAAGNVWTYLRTAGPEPAPGDLLVAFNLGETPASIETPSGYELRSVTPSPPSGDAASTDGNAVNLLAKSAAALVLA
jgi:glycosidase